MTDISQVVAKAAEVMIGKFSGDLVNKFRRVTQNQILPFCALCVSVVKSGWRSCWLAPEPIDRSSRCLVGRERSRG